MYVKTDADLCCGSGMCRQAAPTVFGQDVQTGLVQILDATPAEHLHAAVLDAIEACPVMAISAELP